jgi:hypothetical protein
LAPAFSLGNEVATSTFTSSPVELKFHKDYQNATKNRVFLQACQGDADVYVVLYETRLDEGFDCNFLFHGTSFSLA